MARRERNNPEWQALITEHQILKRKLQSKSEALLILSKDLDRAQNERDQFKVMAEKLQERCQAYKRQHADFLLTGDKPKLVQMLQNMKNQKAACQRHNEVLQQKLNEAVGDVKLLREKFARQTVGDEGIGARHFPLHEREELVVQLEESQQQCEHWRREYESQVEVANEALADRDGSRDKADRLNQELSRVLSGDKKRIIDIDALCMENKYLQERVSQCLAEKNSLHSQINKYKNIISAKKSSKGDSLKTVGLRTADVVISPKHLRDVLSKGATHNSAEKIADLQSIVSTLLETVNDKNLALHHLRNTNKILGNRVSDLERKLKTLEVAGFWNIQGSNDSVSVRSESKSADLLKPQISAASRYSDNCSSEETQSVTDDDDNGNDDLGSRSENEKSVANSKQYENGDHVGLQENISVVSLPPPIDESCGDKKVDAWLKSSVDSPVKGNISPITDSSTPNNSVEAEYDLVMEAISTNSEEAQTSNEA